MAAIGKNNTRVMVTLPQEAAEKIKEQAKRENRSLSNLVQTIILDYYNRKEKEGKE